MRRATVTLLLVLLIPAAIRAGEILRFGVIGDSGTGDEHQRLVARSMTNWQDQYPWELVLMLGDNIYEDGNPAYFERKFKGPYRELMERGVRFHASLGNHDVRHRAARLGCAQVEDEAFGYAGKRDEYVVEAGPMIEGKRLVRFIALNSTAWMEHYVAGKPDHTECQGTQEGRVEQLDRWLRESDSYHWNILFQHHPLYSHVRRWPILGCRRGHGSAVELREWLEPRIQGRVDAVFAGHDHFYQKLKPQRGIHHFVSGSAGKLRGGGDHGHSQVEHGAQLRHFLDVELTRDELRYRAVDKDGRVFHQGVIRKAGSVPATASASSAP